MAKYIMVLITAAIVTASAGAGTITGTVLGLDGLPLKELQDFTATASVGNTVVAVGRLTSAAPPFTYQIVINNAAVNPEDVRVRLDFTARDRIPSSFDNLPGTANHTINIAMPIQEPCCERCEKLTFWQRLRMRCLGK
jgi:hypothetical protein